MAGHGVEATGEATHWYSCPRPVLKHEAVPALPANAVEGRLSQTPLDLETPASHSACMHPLETREPSHSHCLMGVYPTKTAGRESRRVGHQRGSWSVTDNPVPRYRSSPARAASITCSWSRRGSRSRCPARSLVWTGGRSSPSRSCLLRRRTDRRHRIRAPKRPLRAASRVSPGPLQFEDRLVSNRFRHLPRCRARALHRPR
jgi:hypothetical protein